MIRGFLPRNTQIWYNIHNIHKDLQTLPFQIPLEFIFHLEILEALQRI